MNRIVAFLCLTVLVFACGRSRASEVRQSATTVVDSNGPIDGFYPRTADSSLARGLTRYRIFIPAGYDGKRAYPMVLWLHGAGGSGTDNRRQIVGDQIAGTRVWTTAKAQKAHPAFVVAPQLRGPIFGADGGQSIEYGRLLRVIAAVRSEFRIDSTRVYVAGQSNGGAVAWDLLKYLRPQRFAAAVLVCAATLDTTVDDVRVPVWLFHGDKDYISVEISRAIARGLRATGQSPRYSEYKGMDHSIWTRAFAEPELVDWVFRQKR